MTFIPHRPLIAALLFLLAAMSITPAARAQGPDDSRLMLGVGVFGFGVASDPNQLEARATYRFSQGILQNLFGTDSFRGFKPIVGAAGQSSGSFFGYVGLAAPFVFGNQDRWEAVLEGGPGIYEQGNSRLFLGGTFEFHVAAQVSYAVTDNGRLGFGIYHISNANTHRKNPGVNSLLASWTITFGGS